MSGSFWIDKYKLIASIAGWISIVGAFILAAISFVFLLNGEAPVRDRLAWVLQNIVFSPLIAGVACLALVDLIDVLLEVRYSLRELKDDINAARKRQEQRRNSLSV